MKILHVTTEAQIGGAGIAAYRLHKGQRCLGAESFMLVNKKKQAEDFIIGPEKKFDKVMARLCPLLDKIPGRFSALKIDRLSSAWAPTRLLSRIKALSPDIVNLHWINDGFVRIEALTAIEQPIVWTLHDMWAFAGGEHYVGQSVRYKEGYTAENRPSAETALDVNRWIWRRKKKSWSKMQRMVIVTPSRWLAECARESDLFQNSRVEVLPNGVDHERFHPMDHTAARRILGLPEHKKTILFGAGSSTSDKRKGYHLLVEAVKRLECTETPADYQLVVFGALSGDTSFSIQTHYLGKLQDEISMALVYAAADVFVAPSVEENLANTVLESLSCGTPVVAFDIGGMRDMVSHKKNGYLAAGFDTDDLAQGIVWVLDNHERWGTLSESARNTVLGTFTLSAAAKRYLELYKDILSESFW